MPVCHLRRNADLRDSVERRLCFAEQQIKRNFQALQEARDESVFLSEKRRKRMLDVHAWLRDGWLLPGRTESAVACSVNLFKSIP